MSHNSATNAHSAIHNVEWSVARDIAHSALPVLGTETLSLSESIGRILAADLVALQDLPPSHTAMMDGYAVAGESPWDIVGSVRAGQFRTELQSGTALKVSTGAHIPSETRFIIPDEWANAEGNILTARETIPDGKHVRPPGDEATTGELIAVAGTVVTPAVAGLAASSGVDALVVQKQPVVDVIVTGDELVSRGIAEPGHIRDSLSVQVPEWARGIGATANEPKRCVDTLRATVEAIADCSGNIIVTTGGTAHGEFDFVRAAITALHGELIVDEIHMRPGHPCIMAKLPSGQVLVSVPGNPLAALVSFLTLVDPLVRGLTGRAMPQLNTAQLDRHESVDRIRITPVRVKSGVAHTTEYRGSAMLRGLVNATHLAVIDPGANPAGTKVELLELPW